MEIVTRVEQRNHLKELMVDGKKASWLTIIDHQMRIGSAMVRMGGIADVRTADDQRMKGYSRSVLEDSVRYMQNEGFDVSALFGIANFYHKFGFAVCLPVSKFGMTTRTAEAVKADVGDYRVREYAEADLSSVMDLYNNSNRLRSCTLLRQKPYFTGINKGSTWFRKSTTIVVEDGEGRFVGYAAYDAVDDAAIVSEVEAVDIRAYSALLYAFAGIAIDRRCGEISFYLPLDHSFAEFIHRQGCTLSVDYRKCSGGMMRIINQQSLFAKLQDELSRRLACSEMHDFSGRIGIRTDLGDTLLDIDGGRVSVVAGGIADTRLELPQNYLMQLLVGYRSLSDVLSESDARLIGGISAVANTLFPKDDPYMWVGDHF